MIVGSNILAGASGQAGYFLQRSVRLRSSASAYFNRAFTTPTSTTKWTFSAWVKRGSLGGIQTIAQAGTSSTFYSCLYFDSSDRLAFQLYNSGYANGTYVNTPAVFRDPSAWYHVVFSYDSTNTTAANRILIYVNGVNQTITINNQLPQNTVSIFNSAIGHAISYSSAVAWGGTYFDGYLTEINFVDGQALTPSSFGSINSTTGVWQPIKYSGTYGTNGFYLNFNDNSAATAAAIGKDSSGNGNNWTPNNISVTAGVTYDSMTDVPTLTSATTANYPVLNPLTGYGANIGSGNLQVTGSGSGDYHTSTILLPTTGKWYCEMASTAYNASTIVGWFGVSNQVGTNFSGLLSRVSGAGAGFFQNDTLISSTNIGALNTVVGIAVDRGANIIQIYLNNVLQATTPTLASGVDLYFYYGTYTSGTGWVNFGQRSFTYTPPTGFVALNTYNLPTPTIANGKKHFDISLWTGAGQTGVGSITGIAFQPDFVWAKSRSSGNSNLLFNSIVGGGTNKGLCSNTTDSEASLNDNATFGYLTSFDANGFSYFGGATPTYFSGNGATYVGWQWKAGGTAVTNTSGSITSSVSANPSAGFSIVSIPFPSSGPQTVGHGLGVAPKLIIIKSRSIVGDWPVYHSSVGNTSYLLLNTTAASTATATAWNNTSPTSSVFTLGSGFITANYGANGIAYCFSEIAGYSKFGSYTGNGATDGVFVYLGFRPRFVLIKKSSAAGDSWFTFDSARETYNVESLWLAPNLSNAETTNTFADFLSNGFKIRGSISAFNASGATFIYAAFAESPFNYSLAR